MSHREITLGKYRIRDNDTHFRVFVNEGEIVQRFDIDSTRESRLSFKARNFDWFVWQIEGANHYHAKAAEQVRKNVKKRLSPPSIWERLGRWIVKKLVKGEDK